MLRCRIDDKETNGVLNQKIKLKKIIKSNSVFAICVAILMKKCKIFCNKLLNNASIFVDKIYG